MQDRMKHPEIRMVVVVFLFDLLFVLLAIGFLAHNHAQHKQHIDTTGHNLAQLLEQVVADKARLVADAVARVENDLEQQLAASGKLNHGRIEQLLQREMAQLPELDAIRIADKAGNVILGKEVHPSTPLNWLDRDFFQHLHQHQIKELIVSEPVISKHTEKWIVSFSRSYRTPNNDFAGVVSAAFPVDSFMPLLALANLKPTDTVALRSSQTGGLISRIPPLAGPTGEPGNTVASKEYSAALASGQRIASYHAVHTVDGVERTYYYRRLAPYPFTIAVGLDEEEYLAQWYNSVVAVGILLSLVWLGSLAFTRQTIGHLRDRTAEEQARSEDLARRQILIDQSRDGIVVLDHQGGVWEVNQSFAEMLGYSVEEVRQLHAWDWVAEWTREKALEIIATIDTSGDHFETRHRRKDGSLVDVEISLNGALCSGEKLVFCVCRDITERNEAMEALRRSEAKWRNIIASTPQIGIVLNPQGRIVFANAHFLHLVDYREEEVIGQNWFDWFLPPAIRDDIQRMFFRVMEHAATLDFSTYENDILTKEGAVRRVAWFNTLNKDLHGRIIDLTCLGVDLTERQQAEEERKQLEAQLIQAQKLEAIGTLAGGIAHDFNNILSAVIGYTEMAKDNLPADAPAVRDLDRVLEASLRAAELVKQILTFSRQSAAERIPLQPATVLREVLKLLRPSFPSTITIDQRFMTNRAILADPIQIHQVAMNLCTNALHAMEQSGGTITLSLEECQLSADDLRQYPKARPGHYVVLGVADTGPGIPPEIRNRIFEPYFTTKKIGRGTGLGLAIVHGIATAAGGFVTCSSEPGKGSRFSVYFPALEETAGLAATVEEPVPSGREHILLVDDESLLAEMGQVMLERLGYTVTVCTSSQEALSTFLNQPELFDVVITDQTMPGTTGVELAKRMLQIRPNLPIILCTGFSNLVDEGLAKSYGIMGFAMKPLTKHHIATLLRTVLAARPSDQDSTPNYIGP